ncbi:hypothetical protein IQ269_12750 [Tychonema sp. LEGE 07199]|uniref:hypothetical protein n=1 Tax=unclassified Tychonema TaxID=2642144 RepID=UPI00187E6E88|nr:hypothetical protein [Tychonema sp. LEGE 07199]MBE9130410.1 hypothetical protein [Tychonema sp. LEGE 07196]
MAPCKSVDESDSLKGDRYEGQWENGKRNGFGVMIYTNGTRKEQFWNNGELVQLPTSPSPEFLPSASPSP